MSDTYEPPKVWEWKQNSNQAFGNINRPTAGAQQEKELPVGKHPFQLHANEYSQDSLRLLRPSNKMDTAMNYRCLLKQYLLLQVLDQLSLAEMYTPIWVQNAVSIRIQ